MTNLDTKLLRSFVSVASTGSMTQTAYDTRQTQGAVSQQIKRLEAILGQPLLLRSGKGLTLTAAGQQFFPAAKDIITSCDAIFNQFQSHSGSKKIRFGMPYDLVSVYLSPILDRFSALFRHIDVELYCEASPDLRKMVDDNRLDLAIIEEAMDAAAGDILRVEPLVWFGKFGGQAHKKRPLPVSLVAETCAFRPSVHNTLGEARLDWRTVFENGDINATLATVRSDMSVSAGLKSLVPSDLAILAKSDGLPDLPSLAITSYPPDALLHASVRELSNIINQTFAPMRS